MNSRGLRKVLVTSSILILVLSVVSTDIARSDSTNYTSGKPIPELSWASGDGFPAVDGRTIFPTLAPPIFPPPAYSTHWYAGSVYPYGGPTQNARTIYMSITVPYSPPKSDEFYYVLLSAWDSAGSYDQIGFSDTYGTWGLTYSWTSGSPSNPTYHYSPNAMALSLGVTYTFYITTASGVTHFVVYQNSTQVWSLDAPTGGSYLVLSYSYAGYYDYTDYEEVWQTSISGGSPAFDFNFINNYWITTDGVANAATWNTWSSAKPSNVAVIVSGNAVLVDNPRGTILFETNPTSFVGSPGTITFSNGTYSNGQSVDYADGNYQATANAPTGYKFYHWEYSGSSGSGVYVPSISDISTTVQIRGNGYLKAVYSTGITISNFDSMFAANNVSMIYPSDKTLKPLGCHAAMVSDWLASMAISTKLKNYTEGLDTDSKFVNQSTGRAIGNSGTGIVSFGGPYVNPVVKYAELDSTPLPDRVPIRFHEDSVANIYSFKLWNGTTIPGASLPSSIIDQGQDMFVVEVYNDANNRSMLLCYGFGWKGTYAAGKYFDTMIYPNLGSYPYGWIIVKWNDTNGNGFVNNPGDGDTYTVVAADPSSLTTVYSEAASNKPQSGSSWVKVSDPSSLSGLVMKASKSSPNGAMQHGPYISTEQGGGSMLGRQYTAFFKLKVSSNLTASDVAYIDVCCNNGTTVLAWTWVKAIDLSSNVWQYCQLNFVTPKSMTRGLEFRIQNLNNGVADVFVDLIQIKR